MSEHLPAVPEETLLPDTASGNGRAADLQSVSYDLEPEDGGVDLRRYLAAVLRYKWAVLLLTAMGAAAGFFLAQRVQPEYVANATIWIETESRGAQAQGPIRSEGLLESQAWVDLLHSYVVLDPVVHEQRLYLEYENPRDSLAFGGFELRDRFRPDGYALAISPDGRGFQLKTSGGVVLQRGESGDSIGGDIGLAWAPAPATLGRDREIRFSVVTPRDASNRLRDQVQTRLPQQFGNFLRLELAGSDPERVAGTLNSLADQYVDVAAELKRSKLDELTALLQEQLQYAEENLRQAEMELEGFRVQTITLPTESSTPVSPGLESTRSDVFSSYFQLKIEREQLRRDAEAVQTALRDQSATGDTPIERLWAIESVQQSAELRDALEELTRKQAELRALRMRYTDEHQEVQRLAADLETLEKGTVPRLARGVLAQIQHRESTIADLVGSASGELREIPPRMIEEARLRRRVAIAEDLYTTIQQRYEAARLAAVSSIPDVRILDRAAVPHRPTNPTEGPQLIIMAILGSLGLAVGGAILRDRTDRRIRYPDQVTSDIGLPILGAVPLAAKRKGITEQTDQVIEAFRELRLGLLHAHGAAGPVILTVTSPGVGDGKSFVSSNLALAFADLGYRTLIIDGDIRRGTLHDILGGSRKPGLTDLLAGACSEADAVQRTSYDFIDFIGAGTWRRSGPELLGSPAMRELLTNARTRYRAIIVDSSPLGAGADPYILSTMTGNMVMVLRTGASDRELAEAKLELVQRLPVRVLGAVLNAVPSRGAYRYYSYFSDYQIGAEDEDERADEPVGVAVV